MYVKKKQEGGFSSSGSEATLFEQAQAGCSESVNVLMARHERLIRYAVKRQVLFDFPFEEAVQEGRHGLWRAILRYDPHRGTAFSTYAYIAIVRRVWAAVKRHYEANQREHAIENWRILFRGYELGLVERQEAAEVRQVLEELVMGLPERLRFVMVAYYGLDGSPRRVYREIGTQLGLCKQRVQQLHAEALVWLRHPAHSQELRSLLRRHSAREYEWANEVAQAWLRRRGGRNGYDPVA
jgi:RNA polymerase sigma factor (sigma-70 family)